MMKLLCVKDVVVYERTVFIKGRVYEGHKTSATGKSGGVEVRGGLGLGVWDKKDKTLDQHFRDVTNYSGKKLQKAIDKLSD